MKLEIYPGRLSGTLVPPPSKSVLNRAVLAGALAEGESRIGNAALSGDVCAALRCAAALGAKWHVDGGVLHINGIGGACSGADLPVFDCGESATALRFFIPAALVLCGGGVFTGRGRLLQRPLEPYFSVFDKNNIDHSLTGSSLAVHGELHAGKYELPGNVSSQFFSGLLFALALCEGESELISTTPPESVGYVSMTLDMLSTAGIACGKSENGFFVRGGEYHAINITTETDWSQAAFWLAANYLGSDIKTDGLDKNSRQADRRIVDIISTLKQNGAVSLDLSQCPDLLPPAALMAALRDGDCRVAGCARLRFKESDRLAAVTELLNALGAEIRELPDGLFVHGKNRLRGGATVDPHGDHRIAMMAAVAATVCESSVILKNADCVNKSYPNFFEHFSMLGGEYHELL